MNLVMRHSSHKSQLHLNTKVYKDETRMHRIICAVKAVPNSKNGHMLDARKRKGSN